MRIWNALTQYLLSIVLGLVMTAMFPAQSLGAEAPIASAEKTSFAEVTSHLDPGGTLYFYLSTEQLLADLGQRVAELRNAVQSLSGMSDSDRQNLTHVLDVLTGIIKDSGIQEVSGFGASSIAREPGLYLTKALLHHYKGKGSGFLWSMFGQKPHKLESVEFFPETTALGYVGDIDVRLLWSTIRAQLRKIDVPQVQQGLDQLPQAFEGATGLDLDKTLASLGGEFGMAMMLDEGSKIVLPVPNASIKIPEPSLLIFAKVKDDLIFDRLASLMEQTGQPVDKKDKPGLKMRTLALQIPLPVETRPTIARSGDYLFIANSDSVIEQVLAAKSGAGKRLTANPEFVRLSKGLPLEGNHFSFVSERFGRTIFSVQQQAIKSSENADGGAQLLQSLLGTNAAGCSCAVSANTEEGWMFMANGNQHPAKLVLAATIAPAAISAAIVLPALAKAKDGAQGVNCGSNLRQIQLAKKMWATDENKSDTDTPSRADLEKYFPNRQMPVCPKGGHYEINALKKDPTCSIPGHKIRATPDK